MRTDDLFLTIRTEGALLPADLLQRIAQGDAPGLAPTDYHLSGEKLNEATNRAWNRMQAAWVNFQNARKALDPADAGTSITRERWLLPLFQELGYGRLSVARTQELDGKPYAISHLWQGTPIHLVGCNVDLDRRSAGVTGASRSSPYSLLQEFLNRSKDDRWGMVSNGLCLRLLRDNISLTRQAYVDFDLEQMMTAQAYPDFVMLWLLCHESRVEAEHPRDCWLEKWSYSAREQGVRFLEGLRRAVQSGIEHLGQGFLAHPANGALRERLRSGALAPQEYYRQVLRLIYRLLFLFVAEDREVLLVPGAPAAVRERYLTYYATTRLRRYAMRRTGSRHSDLFAGLRVVMRKLGDEGCPDLALPALGSFLFSPAALADIETCDISNYHLLDAVYALAVTRDGQSLRTVDYRNLGAEELGSVYESLLELHPEVDVDAAAFRLNLTAGSDRKKTGSYYTPTSLIQSLLDSALDPVLEEAARQPDPAAAILRLKVVDPAAGSGHFLIAAAHRMAHRLAQVRTGDEEPAPDAMRTALREVISRCIFGVDVNPMAVELCKVSLWMEALEPGKPLSFLEHHIRLGNSLLGTTPALLESPLPDETFKPIEGDDPIVCRDARKENRRDREKQVRGLFTDWAPWEQIGNLVSARVTLDNLTEETIEDVQRKEQLYADQIRSGGYMEGRFWADAWCAAFVWKKTDEFKYPITEEVLRRIRENPFAVEPWIRLEVERLAGQYHFFHWHLEYPEVFRVPATGETPDNEATGWIGGFDVVLGNPPWERIKLQEKEWFQTRNPEIAAAPNAAARGRMIRALKDEHPALYASFHGALREADAESHIIRDSGRYPLCGRGDVNTYAVFAEAMRTVMGPVGRVGCIVPSGIATDDTTKFFFRDLMEKRSLRSLYDFENSVGLFEGVGHGRFKFCLLTLSGSGRPAVSGADFVFFARHTTDLVEEQRRFTLSAEDLELLNPNTGTCPIFRSRRDAELTKAIYGRVPVLIREGAPEENPWGITFQRMFDMSNDSGIFRTREQLEGDGWELNGNVYEREDMRYLPLVEAKMMHHYTHRYGDYAMRAEGSLDSELPRIPEERLQDPTYVVLPRYWVPEWDVIKACADVPPALIQGYEERNQEMLSTLFGVWLAGYHLNHGSEDFGGEVLVRQYGAVGRSMVQAAGDWLAAKGLEANYPLDDGDLDLVRLSTGFVELAERLIRRRKPKNLLGFRKTARNSDVRTLIAAALPVTAVNDRVPLLAGRHLRASALDLIGSLSSFVLDFAVRQKVGGTDLSHFYVMQFPVLPPSAYTPEHRTFIEPRVLELMYTAWDIAAFARDCGYSGPPFRWNDERRFLLRSELDALYFHLYGINREDAEYILGTFPIVCRKDESRWGEYRTRRVILEIYDAMAEARQSGHPYATRLDPAPASPLVAHQPKPSAVVEGESR